MVMSDLHTDNSKRLVEAVDALSDLHTAGGLFRRQRQGDPLPSITALEEMIGLCRAVLFPGYYGEMGLCDATLPYHIGTTVERIYAILTAQVQAGLCFVGEEEGEEDEEGAPRREAIGARAADIAATVVSRLPEVRRLLATDVEATFLGDPAAQDRGEVISCYPVIKALSCYRIAHEIFRLGVPLIPRIITELAHSETGINIHPGAQIGSHFTIDHGTGTVVGATCIIGDHVKLYQGVTLGAKSFPLDADGHPIKNNPRHPILRDGVIVYSNATILGRVTIGANAVVGANVWITHDVPEGARVTKNGTI